jgi:signal transduction histidine kinase
MKSITTKMILVMVGVSLVSVILVLFLAQWTTEREFKSFLDNQNQESLVTVFSSYYEKTGSWSGVENVSVRQYNPPPEIPPQDKQAQYTILDSSGIVVMAGFGYRPGDLVPPEEISRGQPITVNGKTVGYLLNERGNPHINPSGSAFLTRMNRVLWYSAIGAGIVAILLGIIISRSITRPIRELTEATRAVASGNLDQKVKVRSKDEIGELAVSFNKMNAELAHSLDLRRQMTADVAHELRTPISVIIGYVDGIHDGVLEPTPDTIDIIREETGRLDHLVDDLRTLSKADAGELPLDMQRVDPRKLLQEAAAVHGHRARLKKIAIKVDLGENIPDVNVDYGRMMQVLNNLVDNALRYTPEDGEICLAIEEQDNRVEIRVKDTGSGISPNDIRKVFDRFYRADPSRQRKDDGGSGLGLAIAKSLVERHNGEIYAESTIGLGTTFIIHLPEYQEEI